MTRTQSQYFYWMVRLVHDARPKWEKSYIKLLECLDRIDFTYILPMDSNREGDGINLRYRFGYDMKIPDPVIASELDIRPCSVLEMMVALCMRCEEQIMTDPDIGDRLGEWFWEMIASLGLTQMSDDYFDETYTQHTIDKFLQRRHRRNGAGGLFTIRRPPMDLREAEIWHQMMWHLQEKTE